jgi:dTDP-4-dehydrorhamnose reductase
MHKPEIVILGAAGQLGGALLRRWQSRAVAWTRADLDLADLTAVSDGVRAARPAIVVNCAAYTQVDRAEGDPNECHRVNADAVEVLARACNELGANLVQISTDYVFDGGPSRTRPISEADSPTPVGVYARSKLAGEQAAAASRKHLIVRTCGLYGARGHNFVETMLRLGKSRGHVQVVDDQRCTPSYVEHVARGIEYLVDSGHEGLFHVVNGGETTWHDFAAEIFRQTHLDVTLERISTKQYAAAAPRPAYSVLDTSRYLQAGGPPLADWQTALAEYLAVRQPIDSGTGQL